MSNIFLELLDADRTKVFHLLGTFPHGGYLAGGTALALQIRHRKSFDFDVFVPKEITRTLRRHIQQVFKDSTYEVNTGDQITFSLLNNIQITFLWCYFPCIAPLVHTDSLPLASIDDIAADKAMTIGRRAVWRDYVDIFFLLYHKHTSLLKIIENAKKKFGREFVTIQFLEQLTYFEDVAIAPIEYIGSPIDPHQIQSFLHQEVASLLKALRLS